MGGGTVIVELQKEKDILEKAQRRWAIGWVIGKWGENLKKGGNGKNCILLTLKEKMLSPP